MRGRQLSGLILGLKSLPKKGVDTFASGNQASNLARNETTIPREKLTNQRPSPLSPKWPLNKSLDDEVRIPYPDLNDLVQGEKIIGNVEHLLDFVIAGFAKTGTTTLAKTYFNKHPEISIPLSEIHFLTKHEPAKIVHVLHSLKPGISTKRGYKAPRDIADAKVLNLLAKFWPRAKLIVGVRHPIEWFDSFYNYRLRYNHTMPPAELLDGECLQDMTSIEKRHTTYSKKYKKLNDRGVCADLARYHVRLSLMGKTNVTDPAEDALLGPRRQKLAAWAPIPNEVFLYEIRQLDDSNATLQQKFLNDISQYLDLTTPFRLPRRKYIPHYTKVMFDICNPKYTRLRKTLLRIGQDASKWIINFFMEHPEVTVSSPEHFQRLLERWNLDPCLAKIEKTSRESSL